MDLRVETGAINVLEAVAKSAEESNKTRESEKDYIHDGLLYCGICNTPKQTRIKGTGKDHIFYCLCKCAQDRHEKEQADFRRIEMMQELARRRKDAFPESDLQRCTFDNDDMENERVTNAMKRYVEHFGKMKELGMGMLLYGNVGTGKTYAACEVANALIDMGIPVLVTSFSRIANTLHGMFEGKQSYIDSFNRYDLLVIDDLGTERRSDYVQEIVFNVIDSRYRSGLPMIITTNLQIEEIKDSHDIGNNRIYDRVLEKCHPVEVAGGSRRRKAVRENYASMQELLGL